MNRTLLLLAMLVASIAAVTAGTQRSFISDSYTSGLWHMDEETLSIVYDASGKGNTGTESGTSIVDGRFGYARHFNGQWSSITVPDPSNGSLDFTAAQSFTVEAWFRTTSTATQTIVRKGLAPVPGYLLQMIAGKVVGNVGSYNENIYVFQSTENYNDGDWHHAALVADRRLKTISLYVDGTLATTPVQDSDPFPVANDRPLTIGRWENDLWPSFFTGDIDEVRVSPIARYAATDTVACWRMDETTGSIVADGSPWHNDGTALGTTIVPGVSGNARYFDGASSVYMPNPANGILGFSATESFTVEVSFKTVYEGDQSMIRRGLAPVPGYLIQMLGGKVVGNVGSYDTNIHVLYSTNQYNDGQWHRAVMVADRDQQMIFLYVDGELATAPADDIEPFAVHNDRPFTFGRWENTSWPYYYHGSLDEVIILRGAHHPVASEVGALKITVEGDYASSLGTAGRVNLFDDGGTKIAEQSTDTSGVVLFSNIKTGSGYSFKVYCSIDAFPWGDCYWGEKGEISISEGVTTEVAFSPTTCRFIASRIFIDGTNELLQHGGARSIVPGTRLRIELDIKNPAASGTTYGAYTAALLDRDAKGPHDLVLYSNAQVLAPGETKTFTLYCTPDSLGEYHFSGRVTAWSDYGDSLITDGEMWRDPAFVVEPQSPWSYQNTGVSHTVLFPVTGYFVVHGSTLHAGDLVGVFYDSSGAAACAGFQRWTGTGNIAVSAFGDDPTTPGKDGLYAGEPFMWKVYRSDSAAAYSVDASYLPIGGIITHTNTFAANGVSSVQALTDPGALQCPVLREGWSLISSNVAPYVTDLDSVFGSVREDLIILKNGAQNSYIPSVPVNTIGAWNPLEGYQLKMKSARTLCFNGQKILPQAQTLSVPAGWSIIPYYRDSAMSIAAALSGIAADVILVKDQDGQTYIPSAGINTIGTLKPGQGYQIKLASEQTLLYPAAAAEQGTDGTDALAASVSKAESGPPWFTANTGVSHTFIIPVNSNPKIAGIALSAGDCIGAFYDSSGTMACAGYGVWTGSSNLAIAAFGDDATTTNKDGFTTGESIKWRIWRQSDATVFPAVVAYAAVGSLGGIVTDTSRYATNGISAVTSLNGTLTSVEPGSTPTAFALGQNYPNPFNPSTNIGYTVGAASSQQSAASHVRLAVYDLLGREVAVLVNETKESGYYQVQFDAAGLASGIYIYRLTAGDFVATKRLTLLR